MQTYTLEINELQRSLIVRKLRLPETILSTEPGTGTEAFDTEQEEFDVLLEMLEGLPAVEEAYPKVLHGLTL